MRYAIVQGRDLTQEALERYLPSNYHVVEEMPTPNTRTKAYMIAGEDNAGWTMAAYVIPRLASGLIGCTEVEAPHFTGNGRGYVSDEDEDKFDRLLSDPFGRR